MDDPPYYGCGPWSDTKVTEFIPYPDSDYEDDDDVTEPQFPPRLIRRNQSQFYNYINLNNDAVEVLEEEMRNARIRSINNLFHSYNNALLRLDGNPDSDSEVELSRDTDDEMPPLEWP
jgi:hypothetical protein